MHEKGQVHGNFLCLTLPSRNMRNSYFDDSFRAIAGDRLNVQQKSSFLQLAYVLHDMLSSKMQTLIKNNVLQTCLIHLQKLKSSYSFISGSCYLTLWKSFHRWVFSKAKKGEDKLDGLWSPHWIKHTWKHDCKFIKTYYMIHYFLFFIEKINQKMCFLTAKKEKNTLQ